MGTVRVESDERGARRPVGWRGGYSMIELLMALFLATIGMVTVFGMQLAANVVQRQARDINAARTLGQSFLTQLRGETLNWTTALDLNNLNMPMIHWGLYGSAAIGGGTGQWVAVPAAGGASNSPTFNALGIPDDNADPRVSQVAPSLRAYNQRYCIHYNLAWVGQSSNPLDPNAPRELLRAQVRVFWPTADDSLSVTRGVVDCGYSDPEGMASRLGQFRYLQLSTVMYRHEAWL